jgi:amidohydrolase
MSNSVCDAARQLHERLTAWRRTLHADPELSGHEERTAGFVARQLRELGYQPEERVGGTFGLVAALGPGTRRAVALRADMDALPIAEETGLAFASRSPGVMHACGHDAHMAMLLGTAQLLYQRRNELKRPVKLIFQAHEEQRPGGAQPLIAAGVLDNVARIFGLHIWSEMPLGTLGTRGGAFMSGVTDFRIAITGRGGHAAMPHQGVDPIVVGAELVTALQTVASRSVAMTDNVVLSVTQFHAGSANNVLPEAAELRGTLRTLDEAVRAVAERRLRELAEGIAAAHRAAVEIELFPGYPPLVNDPDTVARALAAARTVGFNDDQLQTLPVQGGGEDFAYYAQKVPAALLFLGARNPAKGCNYPHHHPRFDIDEDALPLGTALLTQLALGDDGEGFG